MSFVTLPTRPGSHHQEKASCRLVLESLEKSKDRVGEFCIVNFSPKHIAYSRVNAPFIDTLKHISLATEKIRLAILTVKGSL